MIRNVRVLRWLACLLAVNFTDSLLAESVAVKGPPQPGHVRPPLRVNVSPAASVYYSPAQIRHAYGFDQLTATGVGQKIAIVDAYGNASIQNDLNVFCNQFGLGTTTVQILGNNSGSDTGWAMETALDVEWAHAIAPGATIILSVAASSSSSDLLNAVDAAVNAGASVVSMSWGGGEFGGMSYYDSHFNKPNVTFTASSGDSGAGVEWPAVSPYVISVGGTSLHLDSSNNRTSETAWSGSGGGTSSYYAEPSFQIGWQSSGARGVPDVSYNADPSTGVLVYDSVNGGWLVVGGTSAGAPQWAGLIALANQLRVQGGSSAVGWANPILYPLAQGNSVSPYAVNPAYFYDVSQGNNGAYNALAPYDFVTGLGSPVANALVTALAPSVSPPPPPSTNLDFSLSVNPTSASIRHGQSASFTVSVSPSGGFADTVSFGVSGLPAGASASFNPSTVHGSGNVTLTIATSPSAPRSTSTVAITASSNGTSGPHTHSVSVGVRIR